MLINRHIKLLNQINQKKNRLELGLFAAEGIKSVRELIEGGLVLKYLFATSEYENNFHSEALVTVDAATLKKLSNLKTPSGVLGVFEIPKKPLLIHSGLTLVLDEINDPGNLGTVIRSADAFGFGGVLLLPGCADVYSIKTVQATMGSVLRVICVETDLKGLDELANSGYCIYGMVLDGTDIKEESFTKGIPAVVIGSESHGIRENTINKCSKLLRINMSGSAESLNAAVAGGIVLYRISEAVGHNVT